MTDLLRNLGIALEDWDVVRAETELKKPEHREWLENNSWDVVPLVCGYLTPELEETGPHLTKCCQDLLVIAAEAGNAKENLIALLNQIDGFRSLILVRRVLPALGVILMKIKDKSKSHSWDWGFDTVATHFKTIPYPTNTGLEGKELLTLDLSPSTVENLELLDDTCVFLEPLVNFTLASERTTENIHRVKYLTKFILQVMGHPLCCMNQHPVPSKPEPILPKSYASAEKLVGFVAALNSDLIQSVFSLKQEQDMKGDGANANEITEDGIGCYLYLVHCERMSSENIPSVYSHSYHLISASRYIVSMLKSEYEMISFKAVLLLQSLLKRLPERWMDGDSSDNPQFLNLIEPLLNVIVFNSVEEVRITGLDSYKMFLNMFNVNTRYSLYKYLFNTLNHSGILGFTVTQFKNTLLDVFKDKSSYPSYTGERICVILNKLFALSHGAETDLLEISDELIAEINLAYVLLSRTPADEFREVVDMKPKIKEWIDQIQEGLTLSKAHWELKLKNDSGVDPGDPSMSVQVGGEKLPSMNPEETKRVVASAITTLDVIQFNLAPVLNKLDK